jgi:hypothetical protein
MNQALYAHMNNKRKKKKETNGIEIPEIQHHMYCQMTFDKGAKIMQWDKGLSFQ